MDIKVILTGNDPKLGKRGEVIKVSAGFAQNFLYPQQKATPATEANLKVFNQEKARLDKEESGKRGQAQTLADKIKGVSLKIEAPSAEGDKIFGAVTAQSIADALGHQGIACDRKKIHLEEPIKKIGRYEVDVKLHPEVHALLHLEVVKKI